MKKNYWQECWENYYKFMGVYLRMLQNAYPDMDFTNEYVKVANLIAPSMPIEGLEDYNEYNNNGNFNYPEIDNNSPYILPNEGQSPNPFSPSPFTSVMDNLLILFQLQVMGSLLILFQLLVVGNLLLLFQLLIMSSLLHLLYLLVVDSLL